MDNVLAIKTYGGHCYTFYEKKKGRAIEYFCLIEARFFEKHLSLYDETKTSLLSKISQGGRPQYSFNGNIIWISPQLPPIDAVGGGVQDTTLKVACLIYLMQYQHYNAEFTDRQNLRLSYPFPLSAPQALPGYTRSERHRIRELLLPWLDPFREKTIGRALSTKGAPFSKLTITIREAQVLIKKIAQKKGLAVIFVRGILDTFNRDPQQLLRETVDPLKIPPNQRKNTLIVFAYWIENINCILAWGGRWEEVRGRVSFRIRGLEDMIGHNLPQLLMESGLVPDRLEVSEFIAIQRREAPLVDGIKQCLGFQPESNPNRSNTSWQETTERLKDLNLEEHPGINFYRNVILRWHNILTRLDHVLQRVEPLLQSEVIPWLTSCDNLREWSKGYQNLVEIVMLAIQAFPQTFAAYDFQKILIQMLPKGEGICTSATLLPYGMTSFYHVFDKALSFFEKPPVVVTIEQSYFETLSMLNRMEKLTDFNLKKKEILKDVEDPIDILIVDIHPNNAASNRLAQNDVAGFVSNYLEHDPSRKLSLILDVTLNHLKDPVIEKTFDKLLPYVKRGRLHVFGTQSLAKLIQLGADNFSGGAAFYVGNQPLSPGFSPPNRKKNIFFGLLFKHFLEPMHDYFSLIRRNTEFFYRTLKEAFEESQKLSLANDFRAYHSLGDFYPASVTMNLDQQTVYVALNFRPLIHHWNVEERELKKIMNFLGSTLEEGARIRNLPFFERQSFGFPLTSMSEAKDSLRLSIGVESPNELEKIIDLLVDFCDTLGLFIASKNTVKEDFKEMFLQTNRVLFDRKPFSTPSPVDIVTETMNEYGQDDYAKIGEVRVGYNNGKITFSKKKISKKKTDEPWFKNVTPTRFTTEYNSSWTSFDDFRFIFYLMLRGKGHKLYLVEGPENEWVLRNFLDCDLLTRSGGKSTVGEWEVNLSYQLSVRHSDRIYRGSQIFIDDSTLQALPFCWKSLDSDHQSMYLNRLFRHQLKFKESPGGEMPLVISFGGKKDFLDYEAKVFQPIEDLISFLNSLKVDSLPPPKDQTWNYQRLGLTSLLDKLELYGSCILVKRLDWLEQLETIQEEKFYQAMIKGLISGLIEDSANPTKTLPNSEDSLKKVRDVVDQSKSYDQFQVERWMDRLDHYLEDPTKDRNRLNPYFNVLNGLLTSSIYSLGSFYETGSEKVFHRVVTRSTCSTLKDFLVKIENSTIQRAEKLKSPEQFAFYLYLFVRYPFTDEQKNQFKEALRKISPENLNLCVSKRSFFFDPIAQDRFDFGVTGDPDSIIFFEKDRAEINTLIDQLIPPGNHLRKTLSEGAWKGVLTLKE